MTEPLHPDQLPPRLFDADGQRYAMEHNLPRAHSVFHEFRRDDRIVSSGVGTFDTLDAALTFARKVTLRACLPGDVATIRRTLSGELVAVLKPEDPS